MPTQVRNIGQLAGTDGSSGLYKAGQAPGLTTGATVTALSIGEMFGTQRAGTGGSSYSTTASTAYPSSIGSLISYTLNKGVYLVSYALGGYTSSGSSSVQSGVYVGGVSVSTLIRGAADTTGVSGCTQTVPVVISSDSTIVAVYGLINGGLSVSGPTQELWIVRIA